MTATGVRVYLHCPARRGYLATVLGPRARGLAGPPYLRSGWLGGPHFDLRATGPSGPGGEWADIAAALAEGASCYPAPDASESAYRRQAAVLGRFEAVPPPYPPLRPHGSTEMLEPEAGRWVDVEAAVLALMLPPLLRTAEIDGDGALLAGVAGAFLALADSHPHGLRFGTFSLRSHAEAFFQWAGPKADYRTSFTARMGKEHAVLEELVLRAHAGGADGPAAEWRQAFGACMAAFSGQVTEDALDRPGPTFGSLRRAEVLSPFHVAMANSGVIDEPPAWFAAYRLTINLFYQLLPALDISPVRRFYLCYALAETVDQVFDETWQDRLAAVQAQMVAAR